MYQNNQENYLYQLGSCIYVFNKQIDTKTIKDSQSLKDLEPSMVLWTKEMIRKEDGSKYIWCIPLKRTNVLGVIDFELPTKQDGVNGRKLDSILSVKSNHYSNITPKSTK